jgi:hypothetical protein
MIGRGATAMGMAGRPEGFRSRNSKLGLKLLLK